MMDLVFDYKINPILKAEEVEMVFRSSEVDVTTYDLERIQKMIDNAGIIVSAWHGDTLIGIARAITDFTYCCYLSELAVIKDYQKQGIGTKLVHMLREYLGEGVAIILISDPKTTDFYSRLDFENTDKGFFIRRKY